MVVQVTLPAYTSHAAAAFWEGVGLKRRENKEISPDVCDRAERWREWALQAGTENSMTAFKSPKRCKRG